MKHIYLVTLLILGSIHSASSQTYHNLPEGNAIWSEIFRHSEFEPFEMHYVKLSAEDTVMGGITYRKLYRSDDTIFSAAECFGGMREDTAAHRIYANMNYGLGAYTDMLMYDFNVQVGDTLEGNNGSANNVNWTSDVLVHSIDSILVDGSYRKKINLRLTFSPNMDILPSAWVEGMGDIVRGLVFPGGTMPNNGMWSEVICVTSASQTIYHNSTDWNVYDFDTTYLDFPDCFAPLTGVTTLSQQYDIAWIPNPVTGESRLQIPSGINASSLQVYDMTGSVIKAVRFGKNNADMVIRRSDLLPGVYFWQLTSESREAYKGKIVVE